MRKLRLQRNSGTYSKPFCYNVPCPQHAGYRVTKYPRKLAHTVFPRLPNPPLLAITNSFFVSMNLVFRFHI